ncbi:MAG TPA: ATP-binding protein [Bryobacteraceae bacterium]|nr:ATP-binding protein [Bryobacteraceae bacterium]
MGIASGIGPPAETQLASPEEWSAELAVRAQHAFGAPAWDDDPQIQKFLALGRLAGGVAHDFANLLTLISGYTQILLNRLDAADPSRPELEEIRQAAGRGAAMTGRLLDFLRGQPEERRLVDLNALAAEVAHMLRPIIGEHIQLTTVLDPALGEIRADSSQMTRVLMNLVLNARDAMPQGGRITIRTANREIGPAEAAAEGLSPGAYILVSVTDTGGGMDKDTLGRLFQPFHSTKPRGKGTGLGLSTVYGIVAESGGRIRVSCGPGSGTTFSVYLPRAQSSRPESEDRACIEPPAAGSETILLAEDESSVRLLFRHVLASRGYTVLEGCDGVDALEVYQQYRKPVHLLLTDVLMPRMNGRELADTLMALDPGLKVIYMSGYPGDAFVRTAARSADAVFLQKPLKPDVLTRTVRQVLDSPSAAGPSG